MIKVIGAGLGRTGTSSLREGLQILGFDRCYHMRALIQYPAGLPYWEQARETGTTDWDTLFTGFQASVDYPSALFYKPLMEKYPDAKVILSVRDPERWYESARATIYRSSRPSAKRRMSVLRWFSPAIRKNYPRIVYINKLIWSGQFKNRFEDKDFALAEFERWNNEVKATVPADKLLVYEAKQGWEPLCDFLNAPVPDTPFPNVNSREEFLAGTQKRSPFYRLVTR